ncbi:MAG TPA: DUF488 domain-containing protein [Pseudoxanthomonas sp.]|nr:DUF488 domain-containing protein [Pseudoxanthomonas sp.]
MAAGTAGDPATLWTVGHSTRGWEEFLALLAGWGIEAVADVRRFPGSRRYPWFAGDALARALPGAGIEYLWLPELGGRRKPRPDSPNGGWRNAAFQGYADHLDSAEFARGLQRLLALAARRRTAMMCAEAVWWRCHRGLISDVLKLRGIEVVHIADATHASPHPYTPAARIVEGRLAYPPAQPKLL